MMVLPVHLALIGAAAAFAPARFAPRRASTVRPSAAVVVDLPSCRYTAPPDRRGWRGSIERGEDPDKWYDDEGVRNGPPRNYFAQSREERYHTAAFELVSTVCTADDVSSALPLVSQMETLMSIQQPLLNKQLFGTWAPVLLGGEVVAGLVGADAPKAISCVITTSERLRVPATLTIKRAGERVTTTNGYGTSDAHLKPGEQIRLTLARAAAAEGGDAAASEAVIGAIAGNPEPTRVPWESAPTTEGGEPALRDGLLLGRVSVLNEYMLIQRDASGELADVWMRCDSEPRQLRQADLYSDPTREGRRVARSGAGDS